ncbi:MAG: hypothetical protein F4Y35_08735 [Chloroflexi bacterium]|nr:hypothetical protein [Chloroflexota bacterium]
MALIINTLFVARIASNTSRTANEARQTTREAKRLANQAKEKRESSVAAATEPRERPQYGPNRTAELMREAARKRRDD